MKPGLYRPLAEGEQIPFSEEVHPRMVFRNPLWGAFELLALAELHSYLRRVCKDRDPHLLTWLFRTLLR